MSEKKISRYLLIIMFKPSTKANVMNLLGTMAPSFKEYGFKIESEINYAGNKKIYTNVKNMDQSFCAQLYFNGPALNDNIQKIKDLLQLNTNVITYYITKVNHDEYLFNSLKNWSELNFFVKNKIEESKENTTEESEKTTN